MTVQSLGEDGLEYFFDNIHLCKDKNYLTHGLHPYPAKFIPHIPQRLIASYGRPGYPILDPMCGSGTTLIESSLAGFDAIGLDLNPIAALAARAKTMVLDEADLEELDALEQGLRNVASGTAVADEAVSLPEFHNRDKWFLRHVIEDLSLSLQLIDACSARVCCFGRAVLSSVIVGVSNQESETRWCAKEQLISRGETPRRLADRLRSARLRAEQYSARSTAQTTVLRGDARCLPLASNSIGTVITSPPYANAHDYYLYNKLRMFVLGFDVSAVQTAEIGSRNRHSDLKAPIGDYVSAMASAMAEWRRVLVKGGYAAVVVGDAIIRGAFFDMRSELSTVSGDAGFELVDAFSFSHKQFNSTFQRGFGSDFEKRTHVLVFQ